MTSDGRSVIELIIVSWPASWADPPRRVRRGVPSRAGMTLQGGNVRKRHFVDAGRVVQMKVTAHCCNLQSDFKAKLRTIFLENRRLWARFCVDHSPCFSSLDECCSSALLWAVIRLLRRTDGMLRREKWLEVVSVKTTISSFDTFNFRTVYIGRTVYTWNNLKPLVHIWIEVKYFPFLFYRSISSVERHLSLLTIAWTSINVHIPSKNWSLTFTNGCPDSVEKIKISKVCSSLKMQIRTPVCRLYSQNNPNIWFRTSNFGVRVLANIPSFIYKFLRSVPETKTLSVRI